jgi:glycogen debranching enzyme
VDRPDIAQQYYIATTSSPVDDCARVLKYGAMFFVFDRLGDVQPRGLGEEGLFFQDTRHLSELSINLWNVRPLLLSSTVATNNFIFTADLANLDVSRDNDEVAIPRGTLHLLRSKFLWRNRCYEEFLFVNHGLSSLEVPFSIAFNADFADIFEVRGTHRNKKGERLPDRVERDSVVLSYEGLDRVIRRTCIQSDPLPDFTSNTELLFDVKLRPKERATFQFVISCDTSAEVESTGYARAVAAAREEFDSAAENFPRISSSNSRFSDWMTRSVSDLQMMTVGNPEPNYPYAGVPWFSTVFGRDGIITALQTLWLNPAIARGVLEHLAAAQAREIIPSIEAEPGKILHEMRRGEMAVLGEVPFGCYYGSVDSTPLFIILAGAYFDRTADRSFLERLWPRIERALRWIDEFGDFDGDGFVEYAQHSSKGLVQQGWKDSNDSVFHADGSLAPAPIALCEVQGYVYAAKLAAARMCRVLEKTDASSRLEKEAENLRIQFEDKFWCDDLSTYALALDGNKRPCRVRTSNAGHCLFTGIAAPDRARRLAETLVGPGFFTGWGVRTVASSEARYNPLSYHNGSVWPHDNSLVASGMAKYGFKDFAGKILLGLLDLSSMVDLHRLPELFCGLERRPGEGPTLYPVACSPQVWASAAPFLILQACLGLSIQADNNRLVFDRPSLPEGIPQLSIKNLRCGNQCMDLFLERRGDSVLIHREDKGGGLEIVTIVS